MVCVYQKSNLTRTIKRLTLSLEVAYATLIPISSNADGNLFLKVNALAQHQL